MKPVVDRLKFDLIYKIDSIMSYGVYSGLYDYVAAALKLPIVNIVDELYIYFLREKNETS